MNCCAYGEFKCIDDSPAQVRNCINVTLRCNLEQNCDDLSDEMNCHCSRYGMASCPDTDCGQVCIPEQWVCDGHPDCPDGLEEINCTIPDCSHEEVGCNFCVDGTKLCTNHSKIIGDMKGNRN